MMRIRFALRCCDSSNIISNGLVLALCIFLLVGCSANHRSIYRKAPTNESSILIDAKQRLILTSKTLVSDPLSKRELLACAEPSPDVFSTIASSISAAGSYTTGEKDILLQYGKSIAESGIDIGLRTQTIQVLRDMMYRLCERYFNGAITEIEFEQQAARDQRLIVSVLAIEQLTGAVRPSRAGTVPVSRNDLGSGLLKAQKLLNEAVASKNVADAENNTAQEKFTKLNAEIVAAETAAKESAVARDKANEPIPGLTKTSEDV